MDRETARSQPHWQGRTKSARGPVSRHADRRAPAERVDRDDPRPKTRKGRRDGAACGQGLLAGLRGAGPIRPIGLAPVHSPPHRGSAPLEFLEIKSKTKGSNRNDGSEEDIARQL